MSEEKYMGGTTEDLRVEFKERKKFIGLSMESEYPLLDSLYDKKLYGLVNHRGEVVVPTPITKRFGQDSGTVSGINYVVDLFNKFRKTYVNSPGLKFPRLLERLQPIKSFERFESNYNEHEILLANKMLPKLLQEIDEQSPSLDQFLTELESLIFSPELTNYSITRSGYALSSRSSVYHTGLYVDIVTGQDTNLDQQKAEILSDPNFECFCSLAYEHGFLVDANAPWRLVVDLDSTVTKNNIMNGRDPEDFDVFYGDVYVIKVAHDDFWSLKAFSEKLYIEFYRQRQQSADLMNKNASINRFLEFLLTCHFKVLGLTHEVEGKNIPLFSKTLKKAVDINMLYGLTSSAGALGFINSFLSEQILKKMRKNENTSNTRHQQQLPGNIPLLRI